ncbi:hypothetical protein D3C71_2084420 [compost metagenome]
MLNVEKIKNPIKLNQSNVQGQGCNDDCTEHNKLVGKTNVNTSGCVIYDTIYTPKTNWFA